MRWGQEGLDQRGKPRKPTASPREPRAHSPEEPRPCAKLTSFRVLVPDSVASLVPQWWRTRLQWGRCGSTPGSERAPGEGNGSPGCCLGNPMHRGAWRARLRGVTESELSDKPWPRLPPAPASARPASAPPDSTLPGPRQPAAARPGARSLGPPSVWARCSTLATQWSHLGHLTVPDAGSPLPEVLI